MRRSQFKRTTGICLLSMSAWFALAGSAAAETLTLNDGTIIHGEIESLRGDVYTVRTSALGTVQVRKENVRRIEQTHESTPTAAPDPSEALAVQTRLLQDPALLSMIQALQSDPDVQAVLADPEIMNAVLSGNIGVLMNHPRIIALTDNAKIREIVEAAQ